MHAKSHVQQCSTLFWRALYYSSGIFRFHSRPWTRLLTARRRALRRRVNWWIIECTTGTMRHRKNGSLAPCRDSASTRGPGAQLTAAAHYDFAMAIALTRMTGFSWRSTLELFLGREWTSQGHAWFRCLRGAPERIVRSCSRSRSVNQLFCRCPLPACKPLNIGVIVNEGILSDLAD